MAQIKIMDLLREISYHIELHSVDGIRECFKNGLDPNASFQGKPLFELLPGMYTRSPRFKDCIRALIAAGLKFDNPLLLSVLADDAEELGRLLANRPDAISAVVSLPCAYTPLREVSLLHVCAEFNHVTCAMVLAGNGLSTETKAGTDRHGFGGQTPIFHTVNQNGNHSLEMLDFLLSLNADLDVTVKGIIWGEGFPWETLIPSVNPISYAMMGLLPQMHRDEKTISGTVIKLIRQRYGTDITPYNIPNRYLSP